MEHKNHKKENKEMEYKEMKNSDKAMAMHCSECKNGMKGHMMTKGKKK